MKTSIKPIPPAATLATLLASFCSTAVAQLPGATDWPGPWSSGSIGSYEPDVLRWVNQTAISLDGQDAAEARLADRSAEITWIQADFEGPTTVYFSYRGTEFGGTYSDYQINDPSEPSGKSESGYLVGILGQPSTVLLRHQNSIIADSGWQEGAMAIPAGSHSVRWKLTYYLGRQQQCRAYLDQVWTQSDPRPRIIGTQLQVTRGLPLNWKIPVNSTAGLPVLLTVTNPSSLPEGVTLDSATGAWTGTPTRPGSYEIPLIAENSQGQHRAVFRLDVVSSVADLAEAVDIPSWKFWNLTPSLPWTYRPDGGHLGGDSLWTLAGIPPMGSVLQTRVYGPGTLSFRAGTALQFEGPGLLVTVHDPMLDQTPGDYWNLQDNMSFSPGSIAIPPGLQTVSFKAVRYGSFTYGYENVAIDMLSFEPSATAPLETNFAAWKAAHGAVGAESSADADSDGLDLLTEYGMGGTPQSQDAARLPAIFEEAAGPVFVMAKNPSATDLEYGVEASVGGLAGPWTTENVEILENSSVRLKARATSPDANVFLRGIVRLK